LGEGLAAGLGEGFGFVDAPDGVGLGEGFGFVDAPDGVGLGVGDFFGVGDFLGVGFGVVDLGGVAWAEISDIEGN
jgi:hypothetical protein